MKKRESEREKVIRKQRSIYKDEDHVISNKNGEF